MERAETPRFRLSFLTTFKGTPWNLNPAGRDGSRCTCGYCSPDASTHTSPSGRGGGGTGGRAASKIVHQEIQCVEIWLQPGRRSVVTGTMDRVHTEECRKRLEIKFGRSSFRAASSSAPAAAARSSAPKVASSSLAAAERFQSDEGSDHGVKRVGGRHMFKTRVTPWSESSVQPQKLKQQP